MSEISLGFEDISRFKAFCYIYSFIADDDGNPTQIVKRWKDVQQTTDYVWDGDTVTTTVVWENIVT